MMRAVNRIAWIVVISSMGTLWGCTASSLQNGADENASPLFCTGQWVPREELQVLSTRNIPIRFKYWFCDYQFRTSIEDGTPIYRAIWPDIGTVRLSPCGDWWCNGEREVVRFLVEGKDTIADYMNWGPDPKSGFIEYARPVDLSPAFVEDESWDASSVYAKAFFQGYWEITDVERDSILPAAFMNYHGEFKCPPGWFLYEFNPANEKPIMVFKRDWGIEVCVFTPSPQEPGTFELREVLNKELYAPELRKGRDNPVRAGKVKYRFKWSP